MATGGVNGAGGVTGTGGGGSATGGASGRGGPGGMGSGGTGGSHPIAGGAVRVVSRARGGRHEQRPLLRFAQRDGNRLHQRGALLAHASQDAVRGGGRRDERRRRRRARRRRLSADCAPVFHGRRFRGQRPHDHLASRDRRAPRAVGRRPGHGMDRQQRQQEHLEGLGARCVRDAPALRRRRARHARAVVVDQPRGHDVHRAPDGPSRTAASATSTASRIPSARS